MMNRLKDISTFGRIGVALLLTLTLGITACGDDGDKGISSAEAGKLQASSGDTLPFTEIALGETEVKQIRLANIGEGELSISSITLVEETTDDDGGAEFSKGENWVNRVNLPPSETDGFVDISVVYNPRDESPDSGYIEIKSNDPENPNYRIDLTTPQLAPRIFHKEQVIFRRVPPTGPDEDLRDYNHNISMVQNVGQSPLEINDIVVTPAESDFSVSFPDSADDDNFEDDGDTWPDTLAPGEEFPIRVYFTPADDLPSEAELIFYTNDPANPQYTVELIGNSGSPCLEMNHEDEINFGEGAIGYANNKTITVQNCSSTAELEISALEISDDGGGVYEIKDGSLPMPLPDDKAVIAPEESTSFVVTYTPTDETASTGELTVRSNDPAKAQLAVPILGRGTNNSCPTAVADGALMGTTRWQKQINTIPLKTIQLRGTNSLDVESDIDRYEWSFIQRPANSNARFTPGPNAGDPTVFLDLAGIYEIELKVFDEQGLASCEAAKVTIRATPDEDIHVQLVWKTPADDDQTDEAGTDVDLHFLHPNGEWNTAPWDIFWNNATADWGVRNDPSDDPSLDIDDTNGAGPENINITDPESGLDYSVGVYYYADNGYGPSYATVRIYIQGVQRYEYRDMFLPARTYFWRNTVISWPAAQLPNQGITQINDVDEGFPNRP